MMVEKTNYNTLIYLEKLEFFGVNKEHKIYGRKLYAESI